MSILLKSNSIEVYDGTTKKNQINIFQENNLQNMNNVISSIETIQSKISDIETIRAGAAKGATSIQSLSGYATTDWVNQQGFLKSHQSLAGYATQTWVQSQGYVTPPWLEGRYQSALGIRRLAVGKINVQQGSNSVNFVPKSEAAVGTFYYGDDGTAPSAVFASCTNAGASTAGSAAHGTISATVYNVTTSYFQVRVKATDLPSGQTGNWTNVDCLAIWL